MGVVLTDTFTGSNGAAWDASKWTIAASNATRDIQSNQGHVKIGSTTPIAVGYVGASATMSNALDCDVLMSFRWADINQAGFISLALRCDGTWNSGGRRPTVGYMLQVQNNNRASTISKIVADTITQLQAKSITTLDTTKQWLRFRVEGSTISVKGWPDAVSEPADWSYQVTDTAVTAGGVFMLNVNQGASTTQAHDIYIDDITVTDLSPVNVPPVAVAGPDQNVGAGETVTLDGSASHDTEGPVMGYTWRQITGPTVTLSNTAAVKPIFTAPIDTETALLVFGLIVTDSSGASSPEDAMSVNVAAAVADEYASNGSGQWLPCIEYASDGSGSWT